MKNFNNMIEVLDFINERAISHFFPVEINFDAELLAQKNGTISEYLKIKNELETKFQNENGKWKFDFCKTNFENTRFAKSNLYKIVMGIEKPKNVYYYQSTPFI